MTRQHLESPRVPRPGRWALIAGLAGFYFVAVHIFTSFSLWLLLGGLVYGVAMAGAGYALCLGRLSGHRPTVILALSAMAAVPLLAGGSGAQEYWVEIAGSLVPFLVLAGVGAGSGLAVAAVAVALRFARSRVEPLPPLRPVLVGLAAFGVVLAPVLPYLGQIQLPVLVLVLILAAAVGAGAAAIPIGLQAGHWWLAVVGWITVAAIPVLHLHPGYTARFGFNGGGIWLDLISLGITAIGALVCLVGILIVRRRKTRPT